MHWRHAMTMVAIPFAAIAAAAASAPTGAQTRDQARDETRDQRRDISDLLLRVNGPVRVAAGDSASTVWVVKNDATIDGTVREQLMVIDGTGRVAGTVRGDVTVINGHLDLAPSARVGGNILLYGSTIARAPGAQVAGAVHTETGISFGARAMWFLWISMTLFVVLAGLAFAWIGGRQLAESAALVTHEPLGTAIAALVLCAGLPLLAMGAFLTIVGIPFGFAVLFFVIPALSLAGYVVSGTALGRFALQRLVPRASTEPGAAPVEDHPFRAAAAGLLLFQLVALVPGIGGPLIFLAGLAGAGAIAYRLWLSRPRRTVAKAATTGPATMAGARA
jgi:Na+-transporting methylmalonyl-CoA/oxaloacetate decarboxylase gamma subunit